MSQHAVEMNIYKGLPQVEGSAFTSGFGQGTRQREVKPSAQPAHRCPDFVSYQKSVNSE